MQSSGLSNELAILSGNANLPLAESICAKMNVPLGKAIVGKFPGGETQVQILDNIRGKDVFIIQSTCEPPNDNLMELLVMMDAARRASAKRITAVLPYYGYARQDRKDRPRVPITSKLVANLLMTAGANRVLAMDLHAGQIQGFFDVPVDHLYSINVMCEYLVSKNLKDLVVAAPDVGGIKMARAYSTVLGSAPLVIIDKRREGAEVVRAMNIIGEVKNRNVVMVDDIVSTGGSLVEAVSAVKKAGAKDVYAAVVHPVLAGNAVQKINDSEIKELIVSDSIPLKPEMRSDKIKVQTVAYLLSEAIRRIHAQESVSSLFAQSAVEA